MMIIIIILIIIIITLDGNTPGSVDPNCGLTPITTTETIFFSIFLHSNFARSRAFPLSNNLLLFEQNVFVIHFTWLHCLYNR